MNFHLYKEDLNAIKSKLKSFYDFDCENVLFDEYKPFIQNTIANENNNNVNTEVRIENLYKQASDTIQDIISFTDKEIDEIENKLDELKQIIEGKERKRDKWEKAKGIFSFALDKRIDVALAFLLMMNFLK